MLFMLQHVAKSFFKAKMLFKSIYIFVAKEYNI